MSSNRRVLRALGVLLVTLLGSVANVGLLKANPETVLGVWYPAGSSESVNLPVGSTFRISINVTDVPSFIAYNLILEYSSLYLDAFSATIEGTWACSEECELFEPPEINDALGKVGVQAFFPATHTPGSGTLLFIDFRVTSEGATLLDIDEDVPDDLIGLDFNRIPHTSRDGMFNNTPFDLPVADFTFRSLNPESQAQERIFQGDIVEFNATASYDDDEPRDGVPDEGGIVRYQWSFGDPSTDSGVQTTDAVVTHVFRTSPATGTGVRPLTGNFTVSLAVIDDEGQQRTQSQVVEVKPSVVCPSGVMFIRVTQVPGDCSLIHLAIFSVLPGGTVEVGPGTYRESISIRKPLTLRGSGPGQSIVDSVVISDTANVAVTGFSILNREDTSGLKVSSSTNVTLTNTHIRSTTSPPEIHSSGYGVWITGSTDVLLVDLLVENQTNGMVLHASFRVVLRNSAIRHSMFGFDVSVGFNHDIDASNTVNGKPIYYLVGATNPSIPEDTGYLAFVNSSGIVIGPRTISNVAQGLLLVGCSDVSITGLRATLVRYGVWALNSTRIVIQDSVLGGNLTRIGMFFQGSRSNTILNSSVSGTEGIFLLESDTNEVQGNILFDFIGLNGVGIGLRDSTMNRVTGNRIEKYPTGIGLAYSPSNLLDGNLVVEAFDGLIFWNSPHTTLRNNQVQNAQLGLIVESIHISIDPRLISFRLLDDYLQDIDTSNTLDGKPIYYLVQQHSRTIPSDAGFVAVVDSTDITVRGLSLFAPGHGVLVAYSSSVLIENLDVSFVWYGVLVWNSTDVTVRNNRISGTYVSGINVEDSSGILISGNVVRPFWEREGIAFWGREGIELRNSSRVTIEGNYVSDYGRVGISLFDSSDNVILRNTVVNERFSNFDWIGILLSDSSSNLIIGNTIAGNNRGFTGGGGNILYHNNFIQNTIQAEGDGNIWDNGAGEGNFWSDYTGQDLNGDGIGDTQLPHYGFDSYPLMDPWMPDGLAAQFAGLAVWPEHRRFDISADEDPYQTLFAGAKNSGPGAVWVQATFTLTMSNGTIIELVSEPVWVEPGDVADVSVLFPPTPGMYRVTIELRFSSDAHLNWTPAGLRRSFFLAVP